MSLQTIEAVHNSKIEPRLRHLAQTLAIFANEEGSEIFPGVTTLMKAMGVEERAVRADLQALVDSGVLERDGHRRHVRKFRFNLAKLAVYQPPPERTAAARRDAARRREENKRARRSTAEAEPCTTVQGYNARSAAQTLHGSAESPAPSCREPCTVVPQTLHGGAPDLQEDPDLQELTEARERAPVENPAAGPVRPKGTGAGAPAFSDEEETTGTEERATAFEVYEAIARTALEYAVRERDDSEANVAEHFRRLCREQRVTYDDATMRRAIDAAVVSRQRARRAFHDEMRGRRIRGMG